MNHLIVRRHQTDGRAPFYNIIDAMNLDNTTYINSDPEPLLNILGFKRNPEVNIKICERSGKLYFLVKYKSCSTYEVISCRENIPPIILQNELLTELNFLGFREITRDHEEAVYFSK